MTTVAIAHDYLTQKGGAERVVLAMLRAFPDATIYTTLYDPESTYPEFRQARIVTSPLNRVGFLRRHHRAALPLLPLAARTLRITEDVVVVSSSGWAHGFHATGKRLVYCYSPARWIYQTDTYLGTSPGSTWRGRLLLAMRPSLRRWDRRQALRSTRYLAISNVVQGRIRDAYGLPSEVLPAPHSIDASASQDPVEELVDWADEGYHVVVSRLLPYKNVDKAVTAFTGLPAERLVVVGSGPERENLRRICPANVRMVESLTDAQMHWVYAHATALVAPSVEDYGLTPLEAGAFGKPTLALRGGGYLDTVVEGVTGLFFDNASEDDILDTVIRNMAHPWDHDVIRGHVSSFGEERFARRLHQLVVDLTING
jgi:glycosyltransferase involved in cell wall biosynthesis